jgi:hypothetical protein
MNLRASTEIATGAEARSFRRWVKRGAAPILVRYLVLLALLGLAALLFGELFVSETLRDPHRCVDLPGWQCLHDPVRLSVLY